MRTYLIKRFFFIIPVIMGASILVFLLLQLSPGDPALLLAGERATAERIERIREEWGLNHPPYVQYFYFIGRLVRWDLGMSITQRRPVTELLRLALPITIELGIAAFIISLIIGIPTGIISAARHGSLADQLALFLALIGVSLPQFWFGILLMYFFAVRYQWFPTSGYGSLSHLILPAIALGSAGAALISRVTRSSMLEVLRQDYIRTARAKGLKEKYVIYKHALRNAMLPVVTILGLSLGWMLAGSVVLEMVFARPGMGRLLVRGILMRDYPVVQGMLLFLSLCVVLANLVADIVYAFLDPKIRYD